MSLLRHTTFAINETFEIWDSRWTCSYNSNNDLLSDRACKTMTPLQVVVVVPPRRPPPAPHHEAWPSSSGELVHLQHSTTPPAHIHWLTVFRSELVRELSLPVLKIAPFTDSLLWRAIRCWDQWARRGTSRCGVTGPKGTPSWKTDGQMAQKYVISKGLQILKYCQKCVLVS